jgi:hypothetical protein
MLAKTIANYGSPFQNAEAVANPTTEQSADQYNRHSEDSAQMTRTSTKIMVKFMTNSGGVGAVTVDDSTSQWGEGISYEPAVAKTGTGLYTITYATEYDDALVGTTGNEAVEETEQVSFRFVWGGALHTTGPVLGHVRGTSVNNVITVYVFNAGGTLSDLGGGATVQVFAR